jgi:LmbE family N-acetylglucosaminyl deacetylase
MSKLKKKIIAKNRINSKSYRLLVVAHPDDETLFFSAALLNLNDRPWKVICVTDANADGNGKYRAAQFIDACHALGVTDCEQWDFQDIYEKRLPINKIILKLKKLKKPFEIFSHCVIGEYGHPHHQDVAFAVVSAFGHRIWAPAYNCRADMILLLSKKQYELKSRIYFDIYGQETMRFSNFLPNRNVDEFCKVDKIETLEIYNCIVSNKKLNESKLKNYKWYSQFIKSVLSKKTKRPF